MFRANSVKVFTVAWHILIALMIAVGVFVSHGRFLSGTHHYYHDSKIVFANMHLFFSSIFQGQLPLWSPESNSGEPLWTVIETFPMIDPIAIPVWYISYVFGVDSIIAYQWTCVLWLLSFSLGGFFLAKKQSRSSLVSLIVFVILFLGPIAASLPRQSQGFIVPFRYLPWLILTYVNFRDSASVKRAILLGACCTFSFAGYQTGYLVVFVSYFIFVFELLRFGELGMKSLPRFWLVAIVVGITVLGGIPTIVAGLKMFELVPMGREYFHLSWYYPVHKIADSFFGFFWSGNTDHGSVHVGRVLPGFILTVFISVFLRPFSRWSALEGAWILSTGFAILAAAGLFPLEKYANLRNWGFLLTPIVLGFTQLFAISYRLVLENSERKRNVLAFALAVVIVVVFQTYFSKLKDFGIIMAISIALFVSILLAFSSVKQKALNVLLAIAFLIVVSELIVNASKENHAPPANEIVKILPDLNQPYAPFTNKRDWIFPRKQFEPFHYQGPSVYHFPSAKTKIRSNYFYKYDSGLVVGEPEITHQFRLEDYHKLIESNVSIDKQKSILGVDQPILRFVSNTIFAKDREEAMDLIRKTPLSAFATTAFVYENSLLTSSEVPLQSDWKMGEVSPVLLRITTQTNRESLLVFADNYDEDWRVTVDGRSVPILKANLTNKAVLVPKGIHEIEFRYQPTLYVLSFWGRLLIFIFIVAYAINFFVVALIHTLSGKSRNLEPSYGS